MTFKSTFDCESLSLYEIFSDRSYIFSIPNYQRPYNWEEEHINDLIENIKDGINLLVPSVEINQQEIYKYSYLGSIITTETKDSSEQKGIHFSIIDGQQRITTISLLAIGLAYCLSEKYDEFRKTTNDKPEVFHKFNSFLEGLYHDVTDELQPFWIAKISFGKDDIRHPKIINHSLDYLGENATKTELKSDIAKLLKRFDDSFDSPDKFIANKSNNTDTNLSKIISIIENLSIGEDFDSKKLLSKNLTTIMGINDTERTNNETNKILQEIINEECINYIATTFLKITLFAKYLMRNVGITRIRCINEYYALSIFDRLNTSGEPLTALETFKPLITDFIKNSKDSSIKREIEYNYNDVEEYINTYSKSKNEDNTQSLIKRKSISTDLVISFNQYYNAKKSSKSLNDQRVIMHKFKNLETESKKADFVQILLNICEYRKKYWDDRTLSNHKPHHSSDAKIASACFLYFNEMNKQLTIPILSKLNFLANDNTEKQLLFYQLLKALTAYTIFWRSYTGGTSGIDASFYSILKSMKECFGDILDEEYCSRFKLELLKLFFLKLKLLNDTQSTISIGEELEGLYRRSKEKWIEQVIRTSLYSTGNKKTVKFMIFCYEDTAKENAKKSQQINYLKYETWTSEFYTTIEHIAPQEPQDGDSDSREIKKNGKIDTIGNLILLPQELNTVASNRPWDEKKQIYKALATKNIEDAKEHFKGKIPNAYSNDLPVLPIFEELSEKSKWTYQEVEERSKKIVSTVWDELLSWLEIDR